MIALVPAIGAGTRSNPLRPKYVAASGLAWSGVDLLGVAYLVDVPSATAEDAATLDAQTDAEVLGNPNLPISGAELTRLANALATAGVPLTGISAGDGWRACLRKLVARTLIMQRCQLTGAQLDTLVGDLTVGQRSTLIARLDSLPQSPNTGGVTLAMTLREAVVHIGDRWGKNLKLGTVLL